MPRYVGLVVHGIGEQERGSALKQVGAALTDLVRRTGLDPDAQFRVSPAQHPEPAWAELSLRQGRLHLPEANPPRVPARRLKHSRRAPGMV